MAPKASRNVGHLVSQVGMALEPTTVGTGHQAVTVWYDGGCPLCQREIALMRRLDRAQRIKFIDIGDPAASCPLDRAAMLQRFHAEEQGQMFTGAAAFAAMWRAIPLLRPLGLAARNPTVLKGLERIYLLFLKLRPTLQRWLR